MTIHPAKQKILDIYGHEPNSLDDLARCVIAVIDTQRPVAGFSWNIAKTLRVSNSHCSPLNGVTNWGGDLGSSGAPRNYPGWSGRVWIRYKNEYSGFGSDPFKSTLTYPGTGGAGSYSGPWDTISNTAWRERKRVRRKGDPETYYDSIHLLSWDYRFFDADWPDLYKYELFDILTNSPGKTIHSFLWEDPDTRHQDDEYLAWANVASALSGDRPQIGPVGSGLTRQWKGNI